MTKLVKSFEEGLIPKISLKLEGQKTYLTQKIKINIKRQVDFTILL